MQKTELNAAVNNLKTSITNRTNGQEPRFTENAVSPDLFASLYKVA
jgi:hypothetical protein